MSGGQGTPEGAEGRAGEGVRAGEETAGGARLPAGEDAEEQASLREEVDGVSLSSEVEAAAPREPRDTDGPDSGAAPARRRGPPGLARGAGTGPARGRDR